MNHARRFFCILACVLSLSACVSGQYPTRMPSSGWDPLGVKTSDLNSIFSQTSSPAPEFAGLPSSYSEFKARCQSACRTPEGAVKMYFDAVFCYLEPRRQAEASKMLRYILHADASWEHNRRYTTFADRLRDPSMHHIFRSFAAGTSPENGYRMSPSNYRLVFSGSSREAGYTRIFLISSGADSRRIVWVQQFEDGLWYVTNNADTYVQVRASRSAAPSNSHDADYDYRR